MKLINNYRTVCVMGFSRFENALNLRVGIKLSNAIVKPIKFFSIYTPYIVIRFVPKSLCCLFAGCALELNSSKKRCFSWSNRATKLKYLGYQKASFFIKANYVFKNFSEKDSQLFFEQEVFSGLANKNYLNFYLLWSFHNNSQARYSDLVYRSIKKLESDILNTEINQIRFLPEHTSNMGHLGMLFLYGNYYRKVEPNRTIVIWPDISPNKYYLNELLKIFPLKFKLMKGSPYSLQLNEVEKDTLTYSRLDTGKWRLEGPCTFPSSQEFPELFVEDDFKLQTTSSSNESAQYKLKKIGFNPDKWFAILHVKEHQKGYENGGEVRDAAINSYRSSCSLISDLGGQVIRMGGSNFPKLEENFPAIDYAHSEVKSEELDFWLWANCNFWVGNNNGAAVAVIPFKKPRLITNLWPLYVSGPLTDYILPKVIYDKNLNRILSPKEIVNLKLSRSMKKNLFSNSNLIIIENSSELLESAVIELYKSIESDQQQKNTIFSSFELDVYEAMRSSVTSPKMRVPRAFQDFLEDIDKVLP
jgi:putative glycosyltransferase (TIGR04372 family)